MNITGPFIYSYLLQSINFYVFNVRLSILEFKQDIQQHKELQRPQLKFKDMLNDLEVADTYKDFKLYTKVNYSIMLFPPYKHVVF